MTTKSLSTNNTNTFAPINITATGLKANAVYDFYVDGKKHNEAVVQGLNKIYTGSTASSAPGLKSNAKGVIKFTFFPIILRGFNNHLLGNMNNMKPFKSMELRDPSGTSVGSTTVTKPPQGNTTPTPLSEVSLYFDFIQTFYIDPTSVKGSQTVALTDIELFFTQKPHPKNNQSQILEPGVQIYICKVRNGLPDLTKVYAHSKVRVEYDEITPSLDATSSTFFEFKSPLVLKTGEYYGIVVNFEDPQFSLWTATQGHKTVGTGKICGAAYSSGKLFRASNHKEVDSNPKTQESLFKPLSDSDLKFHVNVLQFDTDAKTVEIVNRDYEFLTIDSLVTSTNLSFIIGENLYQDFGNASANITFYKNGSINVLAGTPGEIYADTSRELIVVGTNTKFLSDLNFNDSIVITDGTLGNTNVRKVTSIKSDTKLIIDEATTFTNTTANYKLTALGKLDYILQAPNTAVLVDSNVDERFRFIYDGVNYFTFTAGQNYANTDYIEFSGGSVNALANVATNASGNITAINITNAGYGFYGVTPTVAIKAQSGAASGGSSATINNFNIGSQLKGELSLAKASIINLSTFHISSVIPDIHFEPRGGKIQNPKINFAHPATTGNTYLFEDTTYKPLNKNSIDIHTYDATVLSKSLELANRATLLPSTSDGKSAVIKYTMSTANPYESPELDTNLASVYGFFNNINNDSTRENTNSGSALTRHISKKITFAKNRFAEDIRLITRLWKPSGTDVKFYARIHNSKDQDAFDDKDWSELELKDATNGREYSSLTDQQDYIELTFGFPNYPKVIQTINGYATANASSGNTTIIGVGTAFDTDLSNGEVIVLYDNTFSNTTYAVAVVANTPAATSFEINKALSNNSLAASSLKIGKVSNSTISYAHSAFNNIQNDNIVRYYNSETNEYDNYDTMAIKIVLLSNTTYIAPTVEDVRVIGVSA